MIPLVKRILKRIVKLLIICTNDLRLTFSVQDLALYRLYVYIATIDLANRLIHRASFYAFKYCQHGTA